MKSRDGRLVYSTDPNVKVDSANYQFVAKLRVEKSGRGGKTVTVIADLPKVELFLKELTTELKKKCGAGGTYMTDGKEGAIEIQGDRREQIRAILAKRGIKSNG